MISADNSDLRLAATTRTCPALLHEDCLVPPRGGLTQRRGPIEMLSTKVTASGLTPDCESDF